MHFFEKATKFYGLTRPNIWIHFGQQTKIAQILDSWLLPRLYLQASLIIMIFSMLFRLTFLTSIVCSLEYTEYIVHLSVCVCVCILLALA